MKNKLSIATLLLTLSLSINANETTQQSTKQLSNQIVVNNTTNADDPDLIEKLEKLFICTLNPKDCI